MKKVVDVAGEKEFMVVPIARLQQLENMRESEEVGTLMRSLEQHGQLQPIGISRIGDTRGYEVVFGNRRLNAARKLGWKTIKAVVVETKDEGEMLTKNVVENIQREEPSVLEYARMIQKLQGLGYSLEEIASKLDAPASRIRKILDATRGATREMLAKAKVKTSKRGAQMRGALSLDTVTIAGRALGSLKGEERAKFERKLFEGVETEKLRNVTRLIRQGRSVDQAFEEWNELRVYRITVTMRKQDAEKYVGSKGGNAMSNVLIEELKKHFPIISGQVVRREED